MLFVLVGVLLVLLKWLGLGGAGQWSWWAVLAPFALAAAWWVLADATGYTQRQAVRREEQRTQRRRDELAERLGLRVGPAGRRRRR